MPRLLDLFCGAGGAAWGYHLAGFNDFVGVDIAPQPHYPFAFVLGDAIEYCQLHGHEFDAIHASPPCQHYSQTHYMNGREYPDLVAATRTALVASGKPYIIENVRGAPLLDATMLCGTMFGLKVYRHRLFESSVYLLAPYHHPHKDNLAGCEMISAKGFVCVAGHFGHHQYARQAMQIDWTHTRNELAQAVPPAYTDYVGRQIIAAL